MPWFDVYKSQAISWANDDIYSQIQYGIETYGTCAKETLAKVQIMQNK